jgi:hypothetical protein
MLRKGRRREVSGARSAHRVQAILDVGVKPRDFAQERQAVIGQHVLDLVGDRQARVAQHAGLPQRRDAGADEAGVGLALARGERRIARGQMALDLTLGVEDALALHFGRVRGQHRDHERAIEQGAHARACHAPCLQAHEGVLDAAGRGRGASELARAARSYAVLVLGDVREVREAAEGAHDEVGLVGGEPVQNAMHARAGGGIGAAVELHREAAHSLDQVEDLGAGIGADDFAEEAAEEADVFAEGVGTGRVGRGRFTHSLFSSSISRTRIDE